MRELRVVGVDAGGSRVICQDVESGERFTLPADERLRAAARGDLSRLGQIEIEMTSTLRPREIQSRIRAGATVAEVAAIAGVSTDKVERFAHPVLLERSRAAELAAQAHPLRHDGLAESTLGDVVTEGIVAFGQTPSEAVWDAWKGEDGHWAVQVAWQVGHTEHRAHWRYQPGSHGGTADPLDDLAEELTHPELIEPRRRLTPVATPVIAPVPGPAVDDSGREQVTLDADSIIGAQRSRHDPQRAPFDEHGTYALDFDGDESTTDSRGPAGDGQHTDAADTDTADTHTDTEPQRSADTAAEVTDDDRDDAPRPPTPVDAPRRRKSRKPPVPAWEDVLLGVRSHPNS
ncbi:septation protein SepH [Gordonia sp. DT219]|uniref:septation protein SepH n=1 Tax=Gordonia sp. DT219 TaxID=3416658 RepID=UPI003CF46817